MVRILVSGLINLETTVRVDAFPIAYEPVRYPFHGVRSTVSGVGYNLALALHTLGDRVALLSLVGDDLAGKMAIAAIQAAGLDGRYVLAAAPETAQSAILYDADGKRQIHVDLKDFQEQEYPLELFRQVAEGAELAVLCNINYSRGLVGEAQAMSLRIATDVHAIDAIDDAYNRDFMAASQVLFLSDERLPEPPADFILRLAERYPAEIIVIGMGAEGARLYERSRGRLVHVPAVTPRPVVNTIGAGDALFACFLHYYTAGMEALPALRRAVYFAGWKIGAVGAADGFLGEAEVLEGEH